MATYAANVNFAQKLQPMIQEIKIAESKFWGTVKHDKSEFSGNDTIIYTREGTVPTFPVRVEGKADAGPGTDGRYTEQNINSGGYPGSISQYYDQTRIYERASFVPMQQFTKTLTREREWNGEFKDSTQYFTGLNNEIVAFSARQVAEEIVPEYDLFASNIVNLYTPAKNRIQVDMTTGNLYKAFVQLNDNIKNAEITRPTGSNRPLAGSGKKIALVTSYFWSRLIADMPASGAAFTESQYQNMVRGVIGDMLNWTLIECHAYYMPYAIAPTYATTGNNAGQMTDPGVRYAFVGYDPDVISAPLIIDQVMKDTTKVLGFSTFVKGHHLYDCFVKVDDNRPTGWLDYEQLLGGIYFTTTAAQASTGKNIATALEKTTVAQKRALAGQITDALLHDRVDAQGRHSKQIPLLPGQTTA